MLTIPVVNLIPVIILIHRMWYGTAVLAGKQQVKLKKCPSRHFQWSSMHHSRVSFAAMTCKNFACLFACFGVFLYRSNTTLYDKGGGLNAVCICLARAAWERTWIQCQVSKKHLFKLQKQGLRFDLYNSAEAARKAFYEIIVTFAISRSGRWGNPLTDRFHIKTAW